MKALLQAVNLLKAGELVAFPTETVYGLGADATNPAAVAKIFALKGRPADHPVIVHLAGFAQLSDWVDAVSENAKRLAQQFWPGPMTLILPVAKKVSSLITGGQATIGIRIPAHPVAQALLQAFGSGIAAPSANRFGHISPTQKAHVQAEFGDDTPFILASGSCQLGIESTIIDVTADIPNLLRPGPLTPETIYQLTGIAVAQYQHKMRVSGNVISHYAPQTPVALLKFEAITKQSPYLLNAAIMSFAPATSTDLTWITMPPMPEAYAYQLYAVLRQLDNGRHTRIIIELPPVNAQWQAVNDRLYRAAALKI